MIWEARVRRPESVATDLPEGEEEWTPQWSNRWECIDDHKSSIHRENRTESACEAYGRMRVRRRVAFLVSFDQARGLTGLQPGRQRRAQHAAGDLWARGCGGGVRLSAKHRFWRARAPIGRGWKPR